MGKGDDQAINLQEDQEAHKWIITSTGAQVQPQKCAQGGGAENSKEAAKQANGQKNAQKARQQARAKLRSCTAFYIGFGLRDPSHRVRRQILTPKNIVKPQICRYGSDLEPK